MLSTQGLSTIQNSNYSRNTTVTDLDKITMLKGYHSVCLYFSIANPMFTKEESAHLVTFGYYMQYMDDLEDFYEDKLENRISSIISIDEGITEASRLLIEAQPDLAQFYDREEYEYDFVWDKVLFYHKAIIFACKAREKTRLLPKFLQKWIITTKEWTCRAIPFIYVAPVDWVD